MMSDADVTLLADRVLSQVLAGAGFETAHAEARPNHEGEEALFITVRFRPGAGVTSGSVSADAMVTLRDALQSRGDQRFPYLLYDYPDDEPPFEAEESEAAS
ncbi:MAG: hypothetical protein PGN34_09330 [Methylobacterium frigidaeris]